MPTTVLFDLMGVVLRDPYLEALEAGTGMDVSAAHRVKDPEAWPDFEIGVIDEATFVERFFADPAYALDVEAFHRARREGYRVLPGVADVLAGLEGKVERYVASNYPVWITELIDTFGLDRWFDGVYASHHLGVRKPAPAFFERLLAEIGRSPAECRFVDDRRDNVAAAEALGIRSHEFVDAAGLAAWLRAEGIEV